MSYLPGYTIKPYETTPLGEVFFTDGTNNSIRANQVQCEAYGYTYDAALGTCKAFEYTTKVSKAMSNIDNKINGPGNTTELGSNFIQINGINNTTKGFNDSCFINGSANETGNGVNNATVVGTLAEATATNSIVLGGNAPADTLGERQSITLMFGTTTTDNSTVDSYLNNVLESYFEIPISSIIAFQTQTIAINVGGTAGSVGDYKAWTEQGAAVSDRAGTVTVDSTRNKMAGSGTVGTPSVTATGTVFSQKVTGANNRTIEWVTTMRITQLKAGVDIP
jgi:hypothetical protein